MVPLAVSGFLPLLFVSLVIAFGAAGALRFRPRTALAASALALVGTGVVVAYHVAAPLAHGAPATVGWGAVVSDYVLGLGHRLFDGPYAFFWTPPWIYQVTALTPLIAPGAAMTAACAIAGWRGNRVIASALIASGALVMVAFSAIVVYVAFNAPYVAG